MSIKNKIVNLKIRFAKTPSHRAKLIADKLNVNMGKNCEVFDNVSFGSEPYLIDLGNNVRITKGVQFITHDGGVWVLRNNGMAENSDIFGKIKVGNNVHIGINTVIMPNVEIGDNVIVGVGAVVTKDIPSNAIVAGVPARKIRTLEEYYLKNKDRMDYTKHLSSIEKKKYLLNKYS